MKLSSLPTVFVGVLTNPETLGSGSVQIGGASYHTTSGYNTWCPQVTLDPRRKFNSYINNCFGNSWSMGY